MRCWALAEAWQDLDGQAMFAMAGVPAGLEERLRDGGVAIHHLPVAAGSAEDASATAELARNWGSERLVVDGYQFGGRYQRLLKEAGLWFLAVDDYGHAEHYWANAILNQNLHARQDLYRNREPNARLLMGTRYALLRREFRKWQNWTRAIGEEAVKLLVTLGGSDPDNVTLQLLRALAQFAPSGPREIIIVVGGGNPHRAMLEEVVSGNPGWRLLTNVSDMAGLMVWADLLIAGAGTTCWEAAFMGLPSLVVILADNQENMAQELAAQGVVRNLGWHHALTEPAVGAAIAELVRDAVARRMMSGRGRQLVDGCGAERVVRALKGETA
jgi:UDP-2,4-diacetamido-2,4,6-trideoxy-beta-L-altropyranose hydrolase